MNTPTNALPANPANLPLLPLAEGPRKLVRPRLSDSPAGRGKQMRRSPGPLLTYQEQPVSTSAQSSGHAEALYLQKQMQAQTPMVFVLDDGERIEGVVEWYDLHVIKVRHKTRTMIYKSSIKYISKSSDITSHKVTSREGT